MRYALSLFPLFLGVLLAQTTPAAKQPAPIFANTLRPFLEAHCQSCHNAKNRMGEVNFEVLKYSNDVAGQPGIWETYRLGFEERAHAPGRAHRARGKRKRRLRARRSKRGLLNSANAIRLQNRRPRVSGSPGRRIPSGLVGPAGRRRSARQMPPNSS